MNNKIKEETMFEKLKSRKFWMAVATAGCAFFLAVGGAIEWTFALTIITASLGSFIGIEGLADALGRLKK